MDWVRVQPEWNLHAQWGTYPLRSGALRTGNAFLEITEPLRPGRLRYLEIRRIEPCDANSMIP